MRRAAALVLIVVGAAAASCSSEKKPEAIDAGTAEVPSAPIAPPPPESVEVPEAPPPPKTASLCPEGMLHVGSFCIDRWEAQLVDRETGTPLSPYYPPMRKLALKLHDEWERERFTIGGPRAQAMPVPPLPAWEATHDADPMAVSRPGVVPNGYVSGVLAERACKNAGKRLCRYDEWLTTCRGDKHRDYPYGDKYVPGLCNIFRSHHPAAVLHDDASMGHLDPRLNLVSEGPDPLLRKTGATETCKSEWGDDAAWDMNGNLDEWIEDEKGRFVGGFFSRAKKDGCLSSVSAHPKNYFDYSTGVRCCADAPM